METDYNFLCYTLYNSVWSSWLHSVAYMGHAYTMYTIIYAYSPMQNWNISESIEILGIYFLYASTHWWYQNKMIGSLIIPLILEQYLLSVLLIYRKDKIQVSSLVLILNCKLNQISVCLLWFEFVYFISHNIGKCYCMKNDDQVYEIDPADL